MTLNYRWEVCPSATFTEWNIHLDRSAGPMQTVVLGSGTTSHTAEYFTAVQYEVIPVFDIGEGLSIFG